MVPNLNVPYVNILLIEICVVHCYADPPSRYQYAIHVYQALKLDLGVRDVIRKGKMLLVSIKPGTVICIADITKIKNGDVSTVVDDTFLDT